MYIQNTPFSLFTEQCVTFPFDRHGQPGEHCAEQSADGGGFVVFADRLARGVGLRVGAGGIAGARAFAEAFGCWQ